MADVYLGEHWPRCPVAQAELDDDLIAVQRLRRMAKLNALSDFPESYSAGAVAIWTELDASEAERRADEMDERAAALGAASDG